MVVDAGGAEGELVQVRLADDHRARLAQLADDGGVFVRHVVGHDLGAGRCPDALRRAEVLDADRHAVQRPAIVPRRDLIVGGAGVGER